MKINLYFLKYRSLENGLQAVLDSGYPIDASNMRRLLRMRDKMPAFMMYAVVVNNERRAMGAGIRSAAEIAYAMHHDVELQELAGQFERTPYNEMSPEQTRSFVSFERALERELY